MMKDGTNTRFGYSLAILVPEDDTLKPFQAIEMSMIVAIAITLVSTLIVIGVMVVFVGQVAFKIARVIVKPIKE